MRQSYWNIKMKSDKHFKKKDLNGLQISKNKK